MLDVERNWAHFLERRLAVAAGSERAISAHQQQSAAQVANVRSQRRDLFRRKLHRADVGQYDEVVEGEACRVARDLRGVTAAHLERRALERVHQGRRQRPVALEHQRAGLTRHAHEGGASIVFDGFVLGRVLGAELHVVAMQPRLARYLAQMDHVFARRDSYLALS